MEVTTARLTKALGKQPSQPPRSIAFPTSEKLVDVPERSERSSPHTVVGEEQLQSQSAASWADITAEEESAKQRLIHLENVGIQSEDHEKAWSCTKTMDDYDLRRDTVDIDRSGVNTYHFDAPPWWKGPHRKQHSRNQWNCQLG